MDPDDSTQDESQFWAIAALSRRLAGMDVYDKIGLALLLAFTLVMLGCIAAGIATVVQGSQFQGESLPTRFAIDIDLQRFAAFGGLAGVALSALILGFFWALANYWTGVLDEVGDVPQSTDLRDEAVNHCHTLRWQSRWLQVLLWLTVAATLAQGVESYLNLDVGSDVAVPVFNTTEAIAFTVILIGGAVLCARLFKEADLIVTDASDSSGTLPT